MFFKLSIVFWLLPCFTFSQLSIYQNIDQQGRQARLERFKIYKGNNIPEGLNDKATSVYLQKGNLATFAENEDGTGASFCYVAAVKDLKINLPQKLSMKVSFIRCLPVSNVNKKGAGQTHNSYIAKLNAGWFYDWHSNNAGLPAPEYVIMAKGADKADYQQPVIDSYIANSKVSHLLAFNEPDVKAAHPLTPPEEAITMYRNLLQTGLRLGSPVSGQFGPDSTNWLSKFMQMADAQNLRIDFIALHWYDWVYWRANKIAEPDVQGIFERFKTYVTAAHNRYKRPLWITEFNSNRNTTEKTHVEFMKLAIPWLDAQPYVERYAYFFPPKVQSESANVLTAAGAAYKSYVSVPAFKENVEEYK